MSSPPPGTEPADATSNERSWYDTSDSERADTESSPDPPPHHSRRVVSLFNLPKRTRELLILSGIENTHQLASIEAPALQSALGADTEVTASILSELARLDSITVTPISGLDVYRGELVG